MGYGSMQGIPMVASSPVRHESPIGISPIEVQSYTAPWKALSDFALHQDLDRLDMSTPHFQQIVNQVSLSSCQFDVDVSYLDIPITYLSLNFYSMNVNAATPMWFHALSSFDSGAKFYRTRASSNIYLCVAV